jgi:pimeloyl-ACP methyl ester carboxylesterase
MKSNINLFILSILFLLPLLLVFAEKTKGNEVMYIEEEVVFFNGDIKLAGTLTLPDKKGRHPAIVMKTGSGPLNRDEEYLGFKPFKILADYFTRQGIATLRYDSRGVGGSTGNVFLSTFPDFANDVMAAFDYLKNRSEINPHQIGLCGHSEGGFIAPLCASKSDEVAFIILISGGGQSGEKGFLAQNELIMKADGVPEDKINDILKSQKKLFDLIQKGVKDKEIESLIIDITKKSMTIKSDDENAGKGDLDDSLKKQVACQLAQFNSPWFKYFLNYDPISVLEEVKCPVLMLFGGLDLQVPVNPNKNMMEDALRRGGNNNFTSKIFPKANHGFQSAKTGSPAEYGNLEKKFVPGFLEFMSDWVLQYVNIVKSRGV